MASLRDLQQAFLAGVIDGDTSLIGPLIVANGIPASLRIGIYRNNAQEGFLKALEATFPVVARLAGGDWFRQTGLLYMRSHPSRSGNLHHIGEHFAGYLDTVLDSGEYAYFADVARLEWAYQEVLIAADRPSLAIGALATVAQEEYAGLAFELHPALRLVKSRFPVLAIWKANQAGADPGSPISLDAGPSRVMIVRRDDHVELRELPAGDFALLNSFAQGERLAVAADAAVGADSQIDLGVALARVVQLQTLVDFRLEPASSPN